MALSRTVTILALRHTACCAQLLLEHFAQRLPYDPQELDSLRTMAQDLRDWGADIADEAEARRPFLELDLERWSKIFERRDAQAAAFADLAAQIDVVLAIAEGTPDTPAVAPDIGALQDRVLEYQRALAERDERESKNRIFHSLLPAA